MKLESSNTEFKVYRMLGRMDGNLYFKDYCINAKAPRKDQAMLLKLARRKFKGLLVRGVEK